MMPHQAAGKRIKNFDEVALGFGKEAAVSEASRCLNCKNAPCKGGCPVGVDIPRFIARVKEKDFDGAAESVNSDNALPAICGRVCPQERQCEARCVLGRTAGGSVAIGALERYVADYSAAHPAISEAVAKDERSAAASGAVAKNGRSVAVIGSGPSGLTAAAELAQAGFSVTVYESLHEAGGVLTYGIPEFRLPKALVKHEIDKLAALGVEFSRNTPVGNAVTGAELLEKNCAVFIAAGAGLPVFLNVKGENLNGVFSANEYLTRVNLMRAYDGRSDTPVYASKNAVIVGAGNVAMDAARTARRLGAEVNLVYRRTRAEMPARAEEIVHAEEEGVKFRLLNAPVEIIGEYGRVTGVRCVDTVLGEPDASGRRAAGEVPESEHIIPCDMLIVALGTTPNPMIKNLFEGLKTTAKGTIITDENGETSVKNVFAGGDAVTGAATVILAMGAGKVAAKAIIARHGKK